MSIRAVTQRAANLIDEYGWIQGRFGNHLDGYCMMGAINIAVDTLDYNHVRNTIADMLNEYPTEWNDRHGRTKEEVVSFLRSIE